MDDLTINCQIQGYSIEEFFSPLIGPYITYSGITGIASDFWS